MKFLFPLLLFSSISLFAQTTSMSLPAGAVGAAVEQGLTGATPVSCSTHPTSDIADSTKAIQAAINNAAAAGRRLLVGGCYNINAKVVFKGDADFSGATFYVWGHPSVAVEISTGNTANPTTDLMDATVRLPALYNMSKPPRGWEGQGVGVRAVNLHSCNVWVGYTQGFATGLLVTAFEDGSAGHGNVFNEYHLGHLSNNQTGVSLAPGDGRSWVNENTFYDGRIDINAGQGSAIPDASYIRIANGSNCPDGNLFMKPSLEGNQPQFQVINGCSDNLIVHGRWEVTSPNNPQVLYNATAGEGGGNVIWFGVNSQAIRTTYCPAAGVTECPASPSTNYWNRLYTTKGDSISVTNSGIGYQNTNSSNPIFRFFEGGTPPEVAGRNDWSGYFSARAWSGKRKTDPYARITIDAANGQVLFGNGTAAPARAWTSGDQPPSGSCASGSLYTNSSGTRGGNNSLYVCTGGAWVAVK